MNTATNKISANSLQLHEISADSLLSRYGKSVLAAAAISTASTYSIEQSGDWGNTLNLRLYPASVVNVEKINPQIDYDKDLSHNNQKKNQRTEDNAMNSTGEFTAKDYIDVRLNTYEKSIDERIARIEKSNDDFKKEMASYVKDIKKDNATTRWTIAALIFAALGVVLTIQSNMMSIFDFGKSAREDIGTEVSKQNTGLETRINGLDNRINRLDNRIKNVESKLDKIIEQTAK